MSWMTVVPVYANPPETVSDIYERYPNATVVHVSRDEYPALALQLAQGGYRAATLSDDGGVGRQGAVGETAAPQRSEDCGENYREARSPDASIHVTNIMNSSGGGGDDAAVIFVVIGMVVVVVWTLYAIRYLVDLAVGRRSCGAWSDLVFSSSWGSGAGEASAWFGGVRYLTGIRRGSTDFGLSGEIGHSHIQLPEASLDVHEVYWLLGPLLRWHMGGSRGNPNYFQMEFLAGTTDNDAIGVIAQAKAGFNFSVGDNFRWGLSFGALNIDLKKTEGILDERSRYHSLMGLEWGYRF